VAILTALDLSQELSPKEAAVDHRQRVGWDGGEERARVIDLVGGIRTETARSE